jgi:hypothetical protein
MSDDSLTLTIRIWDPNEKHDSTMSSCWAVVKVDRKDTKMPVADFVAKYVTAHLQSMKNLKLT